MSTVSDELRKTLTDPKPLYALAGVGDFAAEKLRDAPTLLAEAAGTVTTLATRLATEAPERLAKVQTRLAEVPGALDPRTVAASLDPRTARESIRNTVDSFGPQVLRERAQSIALVQVGRVLEAAGKAVETYDGLAERGKIVVDRYLGGATDAKPSEVTVVVEQVIVDESDAPAVPATESEAETEHAKAADEATAETAKPQAKKTTSAPRKKAAAPKPAAKA